MAPLESLTAKIHALCPELLELGFGCRVKIPDSPFPDNTEMIIGESIDADGTVLYATTGYVVSNFTDLELDAVGHPINLEHVLKALNLVGLSYEVCSAGPGQSWLEAWDRTATLWELALPLDKQSEETIKFLDDLLPSPESK